MTGMSRIASSFFIMSSTSKPSTSGMTMSSSIASYDCALSISIARAPFSATSTAWPRFSTARRIFIRVRLLSSTTRMRDWSRAGWTMAIDAASFITDAHLCQSASGGVYFPDDFRDTDGRFRHGSVTAGLLQLLAKGA